MQWSKLLYTNDVGVKHECCAYLRYKTFLVRCRVRRTSFPCAFLIRLVISSEPLVDWEFFKYYYTSLGWQCIYLKAIWTLGEGHIITFELGIYSWCVLHARAAIVMCAWYTRPDPNTGFIWTVCDPVCSEYRSFADIYSFSWIIFHMVVSETAGFGDLPCENAILKQ